MKHIPLAATLLSLFAGSALGADLEAPLYKAPVIPPAFSWSGCYAGANAGGGLGQTGYNDTAGLVSPVTGFTSAGINTSGYLVGGQIGCDYQFAANFVAGIEGAVSGGNITGNVNVAQPGSIPGDTANAAAKTDLLTSVTARFGVTFDRWLVYGKGGAAWASNNYSMGGVFLGAPFSVTGLEDRIGWTAGAGVEWAFWEYWSVKVEYDYYGFGTRSVTFIDPVNIPGGAPLNVSQNIQAFKIGFNFHIPVP